MEETRRFLRYLIPGLVFFGEVCLYLLISAPEQFICFARGELKEGNGIAYLVSALLASGALGFLFSLFYHFFYRMIPHLSFLSTVQYCLKQEWLRLTHPQDYPVFPREKLSTLGAWRVVTAYWHERTECSPRIGAAIQRTAPLSDVLHGLGTSVVGSFFAVPLWIWLHRLWMPNDALPHWSCFIIPFLVFGLHAVNFWRVAEDFKTVVEIVMADELSQSHATLIVPHFELIQKREVTKRLRDRLGRIPLQVTERLRAFIRAFLVLLLILAIVGLVVLVPSIVFPFSGKVVGVSDGDTITVMHQGKGEKIRLYGIDCPEKGQAFGQKAKRFTSDMVFGKVVEVEPLDTDQYGRTVGLVSLGKQSVNAEILKAGLAWVYRK